MLKLIFWAIAATQAANAIPPKQIPPRGVYRIPSGERAVNVSADPSGKDCSPNKEKEKPR